MLCYYTPPVGKMQEFFWPAPAKIGPGGKDRAKKGAHIPCAPPVLQNLQSANSRQSRAGEGPPAQRPIRSLSRCGPRRAAARAGRLARLTLPPRGAGPQPALPAWARRRIKSKKPMVSTVPSARQIKAFCTKPATIKQIKLMAATAAA